VSPISMSLADHPTGTLASTLQDTIDLPLSAETRRVHVCREAPRGVADVLRRHGRRPPPTRHHHVKSHQGYRWNAMLIGSKNAAFHL
jgi:hypothetical protein